MAFSYRPFENALAPAMAELLARQGDPAAQAALAAAQAHANASRAAGAGAAAKGQIWGNVIAQAGQIPNQIMAGQRQQQEQAAITKLREQEAAKNTMEIQSAQRAQAGQQLLGKLHQQFGDDFEQVSAGLADAGFEQEAERYRKSGVEMLPYKKAIDLERAKAIGAATKDATTPDEVMLNFDHFVIGKQVTPEDRAGFLKTLQEAGPDGFDAWKKRTLDWADSLVAPKTMKEGETEVGGASGRTLSTMPKVPKTKAELAADAANDKSPTAEMSRAALELMATPTSSNGEIKAGRVNGKMVFAVFDPKTKRVMYQGQDVTDSFEPPRDPIEAQAAATAAQVAQQSRAQSFQEQQVGRKELTDKVEAPYRTATTSADTLREVVQSAAAGNKVAASLQALETTFAAVRAQGLNRVNMAEIGLPANAGNVWDRIQGWWGKKTEGEPVPPGIQKDMLAFADILEKAAYKKYGESFDDVTKRYKLTDEKKLAAPGQADMRGRAKSVLQQNGLATDDATIDAFLKQNPGFQ